MVMETQYVCCECKYPYFLGREFYNNDDESYERYTKVVHDGIMNICVSYKIYIHRSRF